MAMYYAVNAYTEPLTFELPKLSLDQKRTWKRWIDTSLPSPQDICNWNEITEIKESVYTVTPHSVVILVNQI